MSAFCIRRKEMKKKSWSCAFLGMNTLVHRVGALLAVSTLLALGTFTPVMAEKAVCGDGACTGGENANKCPADCTPSGGDPTLEATVSLTGAFVFDADPTVTFDVKKSGSGVVAMSAQGVNLTRPAGDLLLEGTWDGVFAGCPGLLEFPFPEDFTATSGNWKINFGFHQDDFPFAVRLVFIDITLGIALEPSGINLQLMGEPEVLSIGV